MRLRTQLLAGFVSIAVLGLPAGGPDASTVLELLQHIKNETGAPGVSAAASSTAGAWAWPSSTI